MKFTNLKIGNRLNISFALTIAMLGVVVAVGAFGLHIVSANIDATVNDYYKKIVELNQVKAGLNLQAIQLRNALLIDDADRANAEFDQADQLAVKLSAQFEQVGARLLAAEARELLGRATQAGARFNAERAQVARLARAGQKQAATALLLSAMATSQLAYFNAIDQLIDFQSQLMHDTGAGAMRNATLTSQAMLALGVAGGVLSMLTAYVITRGIVRPIAYAVRVARTVASGDLTSAIEVRSRDEIGQLSQALRDMNNSLAGIVTQVRGGTDTIRQATDEIAAGNSDLSARTEEQAGTLEETAASMEQLTGTVRQNADNARQARELALAASALAGQGGAVVGRVVATMESINAGSRKMADIIGVIDSIAFQTNILALNAAVEAARAGEQGRGFAVVASEVRNLAQRSAAAARDINRLIGASASEVDAGTSLVEQAGRTMNEIVEGIGQVSTIVSEIADASAEQLEGIVQVHAALAQIDQATQHNAALVEEAAAAATSMRQQAGELSRAVDIFTISAANEAVKISTKAKASVTQARRSARPVMELAHEAATRGRLVSQKLSA
jgi:methyl-accepting chemotaxis protein